MRDIDNNNGDEQQRRCDSELGETPCMVSRMCQEAARPSAVRSALRERTEKRLGYIGKRLFRETEELWFKSSPVPSPIPLGSKEEIARARGGWTH